MRNQYKYISIVHFFFLFGYSFEVKTTNACAATAPTRSCDAFILAGVNPLIRRFCKVIWRLK